MRIFLYLLWLVLIILGVSFAILNSHSVLVNYFFGQKTIYLPLLFVCLLFGGVLLGIIVMLPAFIKLKAQLHFSNQKIKSSEFMRE